MYPTVDLTKACEDRSRPFTDVGTWHRGCCRGVCMGVTQSTNVRLQQRSHPWTGRQLQPCPLHHWVQFQLLPEKTPRWCGLDPPLLLPWDVLHSRHHTRQLGWGRVVTSASSLLS